jgi:TFIIF-interacting CTD phosphatase-like protein
VIVLDMDETMVRAVTENDEEYLEVKEPEYLIPDVLCKMSHGVKQIKIKVIYRPFLQDLLNFLSEYYNLVVYTAGIQEYAEPILSSIDPEGKYF